jgi:DHA2 family multidrug resistance protein
MGLIRTKCTVTASNDVDSQMLATGALLLATTQFLPELVQEDFGNTATWAGVMVSPGGIVAMAMMFVAGRLVDEIQPKYLISPPAR